VSKGIDKAAGVERKVVGVRDSRSDFDGCKRTSAALNVGWRGAEGRSDIRDLSAKPITAPATDAARQWEGWGTALKPAWEPICLARKPLSEKTVAANVLRWGCGAINVDGCRVGVEQTTTVRNGNSGGNGAFGRDERKFERVNPPGRWPANLCHDGSDEVLAAFPSPHGAGAAGYDKKRESYDASSYQATNGSMYRFGDSGSAARFYYSAKASKADRANSKHPTVKPIKLMQWLCRLITPPGGTTLDPFAGSGTTGAAAFLEGFNAVLIEREAEYQADIERRIGALEEQPVAAPDLFACA
jgi:site-specific DNA-methyltransferase (adenine-specific)